MRRFTKLLADLGRLQTDPDRVTRLGGYFQNVPPADASWALWLLKGNSLKTGINRGTLEQWVSGLSRYPDWLVKDCRRHVGNLAETASLLLPRGGTPSTELPLGQLIEEKVLPLKHWDSSFQLHLLEQFWRNLDRDCFEVLVQLLTGSIRSGCSRYVLARALSASLGVDYQVLLYRLSGRWMPTADFFVSLTDEQSNSRAAKECPYPALERGSLKANLVLLYAHAGSSPDPASYVTYTLGAVDEDSFVPVAKAISALPSTVMQELDHWINEQTLMKKGPVRTVPPMQFIRISFDGVYASARHKCGFILDNPKMLSWEKNRSPDELTNLGELQSMMIQEPPLT